MDVQEFWIAKAQLTPPPHSLVASERDEHMRLHRDGHVRVKVSAEGTEIKWAMFAPNWASLYFAMEWLATTPGPYVLRYFLAGWFEESYRDCFAARNRIDQVIAKSDVHLMSRVYVQQEDPLKSSNYVPTTLQKAWDQKAIDPSLSIECTYDQQAERFRVDSVGSKSAIARLWGQTASAFPVVSGSAYDQTVSEAYLEVAKSGRPRYDHVYAVMTAPDNSPVWIPYQRVILPNRSARGVASVSVISEMGPVDIRLI